MSKTPSGFSGGSKANKVLGKPAPTAPKPGFTPGKLPAKSKAMTPGAPVAGPQRMAQPQKAAQAVNAQRMNNTIKKLGF